MAFVTLVQNYLMLCTLEYMLIIAVDLTFLGYLKYCEKISSTKLTFFKVVGYALGLLSSVAIIVISYLIMFTTQLSFKIVSYSFMAMIGNNLLITFVFLVAKASDLREAEHSVEVAQNMEHRQLSEVFSADEIESFLLKKNKIGYIFE